MFPKELLWTGTKGGLLAEKHYYAMREAKWLFDWLVMRQTGINESGEGIVNYGHPITRQQIQDDTGFGESRIKRWTDRLRRTDYIRTENAGNDGVQFFVLAAKNKAKSKRGVGTPMPRPKPEVGTSVYRGVINAPTQDIETKQITLVGGAPISKDLSYYNNTAAAKPAAGFSPSLKAVAKSKAIPRTQLSERELQERRQLLHRQLEQLQSKATG